MLLVNEIRSSVAQALTQLTASESWRTYFGPQQEQLCQSLGQLSGCQHVELASSGTAALELLLRACRLSSADEVLMAAYDYPGNFFAVERAGARPTLVDIARDSWRLDWQSLEDAYTPACRVLIASHLHGQLQEVGRLQQWCRHRGICLIQDACQALGAQIGEVKLGQLADATFVSFGGSKTISAGRGGAWMTRDDRLAQNARLAAGVGSGPCMLSELQAAVINAQLPFLSQITTLARRYFAVQRTKLLELVPGAVAPWYDELSHTAFYQAGWLWPLVDPENGVLGVDDEFGAANFDVQWGKGFDGFHRRSQRRCRISVPLKNTAAVVHRTRTLHHRLALHEHADDV